MEQMYPFEGWAEILVEVKSAKHGQVAIHVPVLVSQSCVSDLLLGFNVIEEIIPESLGNPGRVILTDLLAEALKLQHVTAATIVSVISEGPVQEKPLDVVIKVGKKGLTVHSGQVCEVKCHIR